MKWTTPVLTMSVGLLGAYGPTSWAEVTQSLRTQVTPVTKVVTMLEDMITKVKESKKAEEVEFAAFDQWCDGVRSEKTKTIGAQTSEIEQLGADIQAAASDASFEDQRT
jgi:predicted  nucleic acid-binding Zn-ribbon protein